MNQIKMNEDQAREYFRGQVLDAIDLAVEEMTGLERWGWVDSQLPALFKTLGTHLDATMERLGLEYAKPVALTGQLPRPKKLKTA